jgi:hypothetical protein
MKITGQVSKFSVNIIVCPFPVWGLNYSFRRPKYGCSKSKIGTNLFVQNLKTNNLSVSH